MLATREGVCQDFAHLAVACLRSVGLAARYVSGYLETRPPPGKPRLQGADASHAWVSVFAPGIGWVDFDPTNRQFVDDRYVVVAYGRDYGDVAAAARGDLHREQGQQDASRGRHDPGGRRVASLRAHLLLPHLLDPRVLRELAVPELRLVDRLRPA